MKEKRNNKGVTLVEVVASLGIIAVGLVGLLALFPVGIEASARAGDRTTAALLGEYVIEQVRLHQDQIAPSNSTTQALTALDWGDYSYGTPSKDYTFVDPDDPGFPNKNYGSGEQIIWQRQNPDNPYDPDDPHDTSNGLSDTELYSRYEVTLKFDEIVDNDGFSNPSGTEHYLMQVTVTVRWPRAFSNAERDKQNTMTFVTYIRPGA